MYNPSEGRIMSKQIKLLFDDFPSVKQYVGVAKVKVTPRLVIHQV